MHDIHTVECSRIMNIILTKLGVDGIASDASLNELLKILDNYVVHQRLGDTVASYYRGAEMLRDAMFPNWKLVGMHTASDLASSEKADLRSCVQAIGILLATSLAAGDQNVRRGAEVLFEYIEENGLFPSDYFE